MQTQESRILLDAGVDVSAPIKNAYPYFDCPEFNINELDAIVLSHPHSDHSAMIPLLYKFGYRGPVYCTAPTRDIAALMALDYINVAFKEAKKAPFTSTDVKEMVKHTICLDYEEVYDITPDIRLTLYNAGHTLGSAMVHLHIGNGLHNFLYSLDWKTPVTLIDKKNNTYFKPIGEIIDDKFKDYSVVINRDKNAEEIINIDGLKTIAFNPKTYKTEIVPITSFIRHKINEDLYEIKTASGRSATVTKSHSVFTIENGKLKAIEISKLNKGDFIIGPKKIQNIKREPEIDLIKYLPHLRIKITDKKLLKKIINSYKIKLSKLEGNDQKEALEWVKDHYENAIYKQEIAKKYKVHPRRIRRVFNQLGIKEHQRVKHIFPDKIKITKDFARFLGYYLSEGYPRKKDQTVQISNTNHKILKDCYNIIEEFFGIIGDIRYDENVILFNSKQLKYLLCHVLKCGTNAFNKRVPSQLLLSSEEIASNLLYGYFTGDGGVINKKDGRSIEAGSKSEGLIQDLAFLLLQFEIVPTITYNSYTKMNILSIYNSSKILEFLDKIGMENKHIIELIPNLIRKKNKGSFDLRIPRVFLSKRGQLMLSKTSWQNSVSCNRTHLREMDFDEIDKKIINSDLMFDQIKEIKKVKPTKKYVYDFKVEGYENFLGGNGFLFLHNTGDLKYQKTQLLEPAITKFPRLETVMIEATYGGKDNVLPPREKAEEEIVEHIQKTIERGGKVLIPVLGVGRAQEIMLVIEKLIREGKMKEIPVYVQGMVWDITGIHTAYPDFLNNEVKKAIFHQDRNPFLSPIFKRVGSAKERKQIIEEKGPGVILATSGMMQGGASVEFFRQMAENQKNTIIFVSYLGEGSLGRRVQSGEKQFTLENENGKPERVEVKMEVYTVEGFSGHAGRNELTKYIYNLDPRPKKVIIIHGENSRCLDLASTLHKMGRIETTAPKNLEAVRIR